MLSNERCDQCGVQAFVQVIHDAPKELKFCAHHYEVNKPALMAQGWAVKTDDRKFINEKASVSV